MKVDANVVELTSKLPLRKSLFTLKSTLFFVVKPTPDTSLASDAETPNS